jgi:hypothetical protein
MSRLLRCWRLRFRLRRVGLASDSRRGNVEWNSYGYNQPCMIRANTISKYVTLN